MDENLQVIPLETAQLLSQAQDLKGKGYRLVQIQCTRLTDEQTVKNLEITYSFDHNYQMVHLRIQVEPGQEIPSLSVFYPAAFLYENEAHDLFGIPVKGMSIDYKGNLYNTSIPTPFIPKKSDGKGEC